MLTLALACSAALLAQAAPPPEAPAPDARAQYRRQAAVAGRSADAQVRLALWCEAHGLDAERLEHLARALLSDPANAAARGLMGLVADAGKWCKPEDVAARVKADAELSRTLAEYNARREKAPNTAEAQWRLALWCERHGLKVESAAHLEAVTRLAPRREGAWRRLGYKRRKGGRWATDEQVAAARSHSEAQRKANLRWRPLLEKWKKQLGDKDETRRTEAAVALNGVADPLAMPSVLRAFAVGGPADQARAVQILGQLNSPTASRALAMMAVIGGSPEVRRAAKETLRRRDPSEYADVLISQLRGLFRYEVRPVDGPGSPGALFVEGRQFNLRRFYEAPALNFALAPGDTLGTDGLGLPILYRYAGSMSTTKASPAGHFTGRQYSGVAPVTPAQSGLLREVEAQAGGSPHDMGEMLWKPGWHRAYGNTPMYPTDYSVDVTRYDTTTRLIVTQIPIGQLMLEYQKAALSSQLQLQADVAVVEANNATIRDRNGQLVGVLQDVTGEDLGDDREAWQRWWVDRLGYTYTPEPPPETPTVVEEIPPAYTPQDVGVSTSLMGQIPSGPSYRPVARISPEGIARTEALHIPRCCFGAGTMVRTLRGDRPIESLRVGDRVLSQDTETGTLDFRPVLMAFHFPPEPTLRLRLEGDEVVTSPLHRFWTADRGWVMARDLKAGDAVRTLGGVAHLTAVETGGSRPVYNLEVDRDQTFFVGRRAALVHDYSPPRPLATRFDADDVASSQGLR